MFRAEEMAAAESDTSRNSHMFVGACHGIARLCRGRGYGEAGWAKGHGDRNVHAGSDTRSTCGARRATHAADGDRDASRRYRRRPHDRRNRFEPRRI